MILKLIVLSVYFSILLGIGYFASRRVRNITDYYVGGKKLGYWIAALSARSTGESGWLLIGVTGMGGIDGIQRLLDCGWRSFRGLDLMAIYGEEIQTHDR